MACMPWPTVCVGSESGSFQTRMCSRGVASTDGTHAPAHMLVQKVVPLCQRVQGGRQLCMKSTTGCTSPAVAEMLATLTCIEQVLCLQNDW